MLQRRMLKPNVDKQSVLINRAMKIRLWGVENMASKNFRRLYVKRPSRVNYFSGTPTFSFSFYCLFVIEIFFERRRFPTFETYFVTDANHSIAIYVTFSQETCRCDKIQSHQLFQTFFRFLGVTWTKIFECSQLRRSNNYEILIAMQHFIADSFNPEGNIEPKQYVLIVISIADTAMLLTYFCTWILLASYGKYSFKQSF